MNREDIIRMAQEARLSINPPSLGYTEHYHFAGFEQQFERFAALIASAEREACAKLADEWAVNWPHPAKTIALDIRSRGKA